MVIHVQLVYHKFQVDASSHVPLCLVLGVVLLSSESRNVHALIKPAKKRLLLVMCNCCLGNYFATLPHLAHLGKLSSTLYMYEFCTEFG